MPRKQQPGDVAYGYCVQYKKQGDHLFSKFTCWRKKQDGPPPEWNLLKQNPNIVRGRLFKRRRMIDSF